MRILVTNDDGVHAPGLAAITRALADWVASPASLDEVPPGEDGHSLVVVAPLSNYSGASAAVGTVEEREGIDYKTVQIPGAETVPAYGVDASPALSVIIGGLGAFGSRPDLIVSGINLGVNVGRSVLHSGTVGAVLTGAQLGISGLAVSMRSGADVDHWETPAALAVALLPTLAAAPARTVLNSNAPSVPMTALRGIRRGRVSRAGIIKAADDKGASTGARVTAQDGQIRLTIGSSVASLGDVEGSDLDEDTALLGAGYAALTALVGVHEDERDESTELVRAALAVLGGLHEQEAQVGA